jgi:predicted DNA-binding transcriptional regulator YafY
MYHPTTRVLTVLELLQSHQRLSGPELASRLEVNVRTARRYITMLQDMGIPIEAERGRHGAYRLRPGYKLPPLMLGEDEALAIVLGLIAVRRLGLASAAPAVEGALAKIQRVLPEDLRARVQGVEETLVFDAARADNAPTGATLGVFGEGARYGVQLQIRYRAGHGDETERRVDPYGLVYRTGRWYAVGYCHLRDDLRMFRLDRVTAAELTEERFSRPPGFDALAYVLDSIARMPGAYAVDVLLRADIAAARALIPATLGAVDEGPDGVRLTGFVDDLHWMAGFLAGLNCPFQVRAPEELREALRDLGEQLLAVAGT